MVIGSWLHLLNQNSVMQRMFQWVNWCRSPFMGSSAENWLQYGGERNINPRPRYIGACYERRNGSDVEADNIEQCDSG